MRTPGAFRLIIVVVAVGGPGATITGAEMTPMEHSVVFHAPDRFGGWPANNGLWSWDDGEVVVGFTRSIYDAGQPGHRERPPREVLLGRTVDAGRTWAVEEPGFLREESLQIVAPPAPFDLASDSFMMRVVGTAYHGAAEPRGAFFCSTDRGRSWEGPFAFEVTGLPEELRQGNPGWTPRTDVLVLGPAEALVMCSARNDALWRWDRAFALRTTDGARTFTFEGWIVPPTDPHRGVMPATVRLPNGDLVSAVRRRLVDAVRLGERVISGEKCWVDAYGSTDGGRTWELRGRVGYTGIHNGNPPALALTADGRLVCVFGNRSRLKLVARYSDDGGHTWTEETVLRQDPTHHDLGYPRVARLPDGSMLAVYYWADRDRPQQHIASTRWWPDASPRVPIGRDVSIVRVSTDMPYELDSADVGEFTHIDRDYLIRELPERLVGSTLLRTLNEDDRVTAPDHVVLELTAPQTLTVAFRIEAHTRPDWLAEWEDTGERVVTTDSGFRLYQRRFPPGRVTLGGTERDATGAPSAWFAFATGD